MQTQLWKTRLTLTLKQLGYLFIDLIYLSIIYLLIYLFFK